MQKKLTLLGILFICAVGTVQAFEITEDSATSGILTVRDGNVNVLSYCYGDQLAAGVDPKYTRSCYIHPLYSLDGKPMTDDFPKDHYHHRGVFWTWPVVKARGVQSETWMPAKVPLRQIFVKWVKRIAGKDAAVLGLENKWILNGRDEIAREQVEIHVLPKSGGPLTLQGQQTAKKGYGGFCVRFAPLPNGSIVTTDSTTTTGDIVNERHKWIDLSTTESGVAIFVPSDHPGFPTPWLVRNSYAGFLNASWPGLPEIVLQPGKPVTLKYRMYVHRGDAEAGQVAQAYQRFPEGAMK
jgi:Methane oxygenase PmoA